MGKRTPLIVRPTENRVVQAARYAKYGATEQLAFDLLRMTINFWWTIWLYWHQLANVAVSGFALLMLFDTLPGIMFRFQMYGALSHLKDAPMLKTIGIIMRISVVVGLAVGIIIGTLLTSGTRTTTVLVIGMGALYLLGVIDRATKTLVDLKVAKIQKGDD